MRRKAPDISIERGVAIFREMLSVRDKHFGEREFFRATDFWNELCEDASNWRIDKFVSGKGDDFKRKAGVVQFMDHVILSVDEELWRRAEKGCGFCNFILAHELAHLALDHHAHGAVVKNFKLFGPDGTWNVPPTAEELEANLAATFLLCGIEIMNPNRGSLSLARQAHCDKALVEQAQRIVRVDRFKELFHRPTPKRERVIL